MGGHARFTWILWAVLLAVLMQRPLIATPPEPVPEAALETPAEQPVRQLHFDAITIITHVDTPWHMADDGFDVTVRNEIGHVDLPRMVEGGVDGAFFVVWVDPDLYQDEVAYQRALDLFLVVHSIGWRSDEAVLADRVAELRGAVAQGDEAIWIGVEGAHALGTDDEQLAIRRLRQFRALGARYLSIAWSQDNPLGHSSTGRHPERGLTALGRTVVEEMERIGLVVDVSHASDRTFDDILELVSHPVMASHSGVRALADHPRNLTDEMIVRVADTGGVVCVTFYPDHLDPQYAARRRRLQRENRSAFSRVDDEHLGYTERGEAQQEIALALDPTLPVPDIGDVVDQIMHIVDLAGADTACIGTDYDGIPRTPLGLEDVTRLPALTEELHRRGLPDHHLVKILGGNVMRVLEAWE